MGKKLKALCRPSLLAVTFFCVPSVQAESVLDGLRRNYASCSEFHTSSAWTATGYSIGSVLAATSIIGIPVANQTIWEAQEAISACNRANLVMDRIYSAKHFLKEIEKIHGAFVSSSNGLSADTQESILKRIPENVLNKLGEISENSDANIQELISFIHEENQNGMDDFLKKYPLENLKGKFKAGVRPYLGLIKVYLATKWHERQRERKRMYPSQDNGHP